MTTGADVLKLIEEKGIKYVDLRFTDTKGKEQHVTVPTRMVDEAFFEDGKGFDGSSIAGWKGIQESDMILMPDPSTADPRPVLRRADAEPALRRRRAVDDAGLRPLPAVARKARRGLPQVDRHCRRLDVGPRERILRVRQRAPRRLDERLLLRSRLEPGRVEHRLDDRRRQPRSSSGHQGRLFPGAAGRRLPGPAHRDVRRDGGPRPQGRSASLRSGHGRPGRNQRLGQHARQEGRRSADPQVRDPQRGGDVRQVGHVHAEADRRRQRQRHAREPVARERRQEHLRRRQVRRPVGNRDLLHRRHHQAREGAERDLQRQHQQLQAPGAGLRSAGHARVLGAQPLGVDPHPARHESERPPHRGALPGFALRIRISASPRC